jgi:ABC-2 type transport system permease protein
MTTATTAIKAAGPQAGDTRSRLNAVRKFAADVGLIFRRSLAQARRGPALAFGFPVAFPLLMIGLFSQIYGRITNVAGFPGGSYLAFMAPAVFLMAAMFGSGYSATGLVTDIQTGYLDRLRLIPIAPAAIMLGRLLFDVVRVLIAGTVVLAASIALGATFHGGLLGLAGMLLMLATWTLGYAGLFYLIGLKSRSQQKLAVLIPLFLPISLLSTAYVPRQLAPGWVRTASAINPYSHVVDAVRALMAGTANAAVIAGALAAALALIALTQLGAARAFARLVRAD